MKTDLAIDEAHVMRLVRSFLSAVEHLHLSGRNTDHRNVGVVEAQSFATVAQGFVDFGNIVSIFAPELFHQAVESEEDGGRDTVKALAEAVSDAARGHADTAAALAARISGHVTDVPDPASHWRHAHQAVRDIERYWRDVARQIRDVPNRLQDAEHIAALRALSPIWHRIAKKLCHAQAMESAALSIPTAPPLRMVASHRNREPDR